MPSPTFLHLQSTFGLAEKSHPDLMEPYVTRLGDAATDEERMEIMRCGLRETFRRRYPCPEQTGEVAPL